ncbi:hypothetical protein Poli38472_013029 [Pythium oligandrum]|uniref:Mut7-C RNAse domain-containing protein n=1 Tax=Pythium oligandrum TaxID=41045 RepID=A0A8K1CLC1_PYTOL|nr:hypothetical protein Poli38472_013029 [Pythium oligandrum]|eukprot:TMW64407.1 hypothetical protein Poli38472_013029 [Pythium oligandrum]
MALLRAFVRLHFEYEGQFWVFIVDIVLALSVELRQDQETRADAELTVSQTDRSRTDPKLLVEILELFHVNGITPTQVYALADHLRASKSHAALIKLCQTFLHAVEWDFHAMIRSLVQSKDWGSAELVAKTFDTSNDRDLAKLLVQEAINHQEFKRAHRIVYNFQLQADFPDIELLYSRDTLMKLIEKQRWSLALTFVGSDTTLQTLLLTHVVAAGELQYATYLAKERLGWTAFGPEQVYLTRCTECEFKGFEVVDIEYVRQQTDDVVQPIVLTAITDFWKCPLCLKIYWEGPNTARRMKTCCKCSKRQCQPPAVITPYEEKSPRLHY